MVMKSDLSGKQAVMARKAQEIKIVVHKPEDIQKVFWNEKTKEFWREIIERRITDSHVDLSLLKQYLDEG